MVSLVQNQKFFTAFGGIGLEFENVFALEIQFVEVEGLGLGLWCLQWDFIVIVVRGSYMATFI